MNEHDVVVPGEDYIYIHYCQLMHDGRIQPSVCCR